MVYKDRNKKLACQRRYREKHKKKLVQAKKEWRARNPDLVRAQEERYREKHGLGSQKKYQNKPSSMKANSLRAAKVQKRLRGDVLNLLGNICCRCGFADIRALQIDHICGGGTAERKHKGVYTFLKEVLYDPTKYQLLCANCNWIKRVENQEIRRKYV